MRTRSSSNLPVVSPSNMSNSNPKRRNRRHSKQPFILEESPVDTMADQRTMSELLCAPTEGFDESFHEAWDRYKDLLRACPYHGFTKLHQLDTFYNALNPTYQDYLNAAAGGNLLERRTQDVLTIIENKSKVRNSRNKSIISQVKSCDANSSSEIDKLTRGVNQQMSAVTTAMTAILKQFQEIPPPASVKAVKEIYVTYGGAHPYYHLVLDGPTIPTPPPFINPEEDERVEETLTDPDLSEYTIKVPPHPIQKYKPPSQRDYEKLQELANIPLNENCSAVILKKLPKKLRDPEKFLIPCGFSELKCKALADLGFSINLMPLSVWKKLADFVIVDYESDPRVPLILGRPFLRTARALIGVHDEETILRDGDERLTLNMRHDTSSYSNQPQKESINLINIFNDLSDDFLEDLFSTNQPSGNLTFLSHPELTLPKVQNDIFDLEGGNDIDSSLKDSIDQSNPANPGDNFVDSMPEMFTDEHALDYSSPLIFDEYDDDFLEVEFYTKNVYDDPFDSKGKKIKEFKLLIDELDLLCDFLPPSEYDSFVFEDFSRVNSLPSTNNENKIFNPVILNQENPFEIITRVVQDKKLAISNASLVLEDFDPPLYEPLFFKEVPRTNTLLPFSSKNEEKVFNPGIHTFEKVHSSHIIEISHQGYKIFKINQNFKCSMKIFLFSCGKDIHILAVPCLHFYPLDQFKYGGIRLS
nr:hypothetical protein [Tanacetum cinerariifolium]